jgi:integrase/recombinase XerD
MPLSVKIAGMTGDELAALLGSWEIHLRAERKSPETVKIYGDGVRAYLRWLIQNRIDPEMNTPLSRPAINAWIAELLAGNAAAATARSRQLSVRRFSAWLAAEDLIPADELAGLKPPALDKANVPRLGDAELAALIRACQGKAFMDRRDEAIIRLAIETAARAEEILALAVTDVDLRAGMAVIQRGKGGHGRRVPFGPQTGQALDRYMRLRRSHRLAATRALWLGDRGKALAYHGLRNALQRRARLAGIDGFHIHRLRHTAASRWLEAGGSEGGLMAMAGWRSRDMLDRYVADTAMDRAAAEARSLGLGDL